MEKTEFNKTDVEQFAYMHIIQKNPEMMRTRSYTRKLKTMLEEVRNNASYKYDVQVHLTALIDIFKYKLGEEFCNLWEDD
jgi:hypothetical protein